MRPPEFTGGNSICRPDITQRTPRFNEAAGIHRRKRRVSSSTPYSCSARFNEAAGIHRRKHFSFP